MENNGIYVEIENSVLHRYIAHNGEITQIEESTFADEIINNLELDIGFYEKSIDKLAEIFDVENKEITSIEPEYFDKICSIVLRLAEGIMENDIIMSELLYADLIISTDVKGNYSFESCLTAMKKVMQILRDSLGMIYLMDQLMYENCEYNDVEKWFNERILPESDLFVHVFKSEFLNRRPNENEPNLTQLYFFSSFVDYFTFMVINFSQQKRQLRRCQCCGNYFIPRTKKNTLYCDRAMMKDGRTCKQAAPKLINRLKQKEDILLEKYERVRNRNYKRYERGSCKLDYEQTEKDLSYGEYMNWLKAAKEAKKLYVIGQISAEEFEKIIEMLK